MKSISKVSAQSGTFYHLQTICKNRYPPLIEPVTILPAVTLWERTSKTEAAAIEAAMETQDPRSRNIFRTAQTFRSDHELWPLLEQLATQLFGEERAAELLAP